MADDMDDVFNWDYPMSSKADRQGPSILWGMSLGAGLFMIVGTAFALSIA